MLDYNVATLKEVENFIKNKEDCCVVNPCGSGKTSIMSQLIKNHAKNKIVILTKQKNAKQYYEEKDNVFRSVTIRTYNKLLVDYKNGRTSDYASDFLLVDEAHYVGAEKWGEAFHYIRSKYNPTVIGFTATAQRYKDQGTDETVVKSFFGGNSAGNYTSRELQKKGVFKEPEYILSLYSLKNDIEHYLDRLECSDLSESVKEKGRKELFRTLWEWENCSNPASVMKEALPRYMYRAKCNKILVYVSSIKELSEKRTEMDGIIKDIFKDKKVCSYRYTHKDNETVLQEFLAEDDAYIKILYSIDKVVETVHVDDLNIVIMLRPSSSNRVITQQFGRINSIGNKNRPLIIDMVNNLSNLGTRNFLGGNLKDYTPRDKKRHLSAFFSRHIIRYKNVFDAVDQMLVRSPKFTYRGISGSLSQICKIYNRPYAEVRTLIFQKGHTIEEAMFLSKPLSYTVTQAAFDEKIDWEPFSLTQEQKAMCEKYLPMVDVFVKNHQIKDEDLVQNLRMELFYRCSLIKNEEPNVRTLISNSLNALYIKSLRQKAIREEVFEEVGLDGLTIEDTNDVCSTIIASETKEQLYKAMKTLTVREKTCLSLRFGLDGNTELTLDKIGKVFGVNRERVRQIEAKALRKLRHPSRLRGRGQDYCDALYEDFPKAYRNEF